MAKNTTVRFAEVYAQKSPGVTKILVDKVTGVNYLFHSESDGFSGAGGITPLISPEGNPIVTPPEMFLPK